MYLLSNLTLSDNKVLRAYLIRYSQILIYIAISIFLCFSPQGQKAKTKAQLAKCLGNSVDLTNFKLWQGQFSTGVQTQGIQCTELKMQQKKSHIMPGKCASGNTDEIKSYFSTT